MRICPITYEKIKEGEKYSFSGMKKLSPNLETLQDFPYTAELQRQEALKHADKLSIQGVQPKLSALLSVKDSTFKIVDVFGRYILKPQHNIFRETAENEDLSMRLAEIAGIEVPLHGLIYSVDGSLTYFIKRFDRKGHKDRVGLEDFSQLLAFNRGTKYKSSMEQVAQVVEKYCSYPAIEKRKLFLRTLVNFLIGNEDMHLKNFSLISRDEKKVLAPAYDFINSTIIMGSEREEIALPLNGKKRNLSRKDLVDYYGGERLGLNNTVINNILNELENKLDAWLKIIDISFLSDEMKENYVSLLLKRREIIF